jgi:hypothetical protein
MNARELVDELKKVGHLFEWSFVSHTYTPAAPVERRIKPRRRLRGVCKSGPEGMIFEPIGAVCYIRTGIAYGEDNWLESALTLELSPQDAKDLVAAANDLAWRQVEDHREPDPYRQMLRQTMAAAMGLEFQLEQNLT